MKRNRILIIHKSEEVLRDIHDLLSHFDLELHYAKDGLHGLYAAQSIRPDLIISSLELPVVTGSDMIKMVRKAKCEVSVIFLHEQTDLHHIALAKKLKAEAFLAHPYLNNNLIYAIKRVLSIAKLEAAMEPECFEDCQVRELVKIECA